MLGILGLGNHSTLHYVKRLNEEYSKIYGGFSTCPFVLYNVDFDLINPYLPNQFEVLIPIVKQKIEELNALGASKILVPNITLHETIDKIDFGQEIRNKFVHPVHELKVKLATIPNKKTLLLGTAYTMNSNYIVDNKLVEKIQLSKEEKILVDDLRKKVYRNGVEDKHVNLMKAVLASYPNTNYIIACTELSLVVSKMKSQENSIDLVELQIASALSAG